MPRNTALHKPRASLVIATNGGAVSATTDAPTVGGARGSTGSHASAQSHATSAVSIATTPANQFAAGQPLDVGRPSDGSVDSLGGAAPKKLVVPPTSLPAGTAAPSPATGVPPEGGQGLLSIAALEARCEAGNTPWPNRSTMSATSSPQQNTGTGKTLNFSGLESPGQVLPPIGHCLNCNIQVMHCMSCAAPMVPGPLPNGNEVAALPPAKTHSAFSLFKEEQLKVPAPKGTHMKVRLQAIARQWSAASDAERNDYTEKAKVLNASSACNTPSVGVGRGKRGRDVNNTGVPEKEKVKRPLSSYMNFVAARRAEVSAELKAENPEKLEGTALNKWVFAEGAGRLSGIWKTLSDEEKSAYKHPAVAATTASATPSGASSTIGDDVVDAQEDAEVEAETETKEKEEGEQNQQGEAIPSAIGNDGGVVMEEPSTLEEEPVEEDTIPDRGTDEEEAEAHTTKQEQDEGTDEDEDAVPTA